MPKLWSAVTILLLISGSLYSRTFNAKGSSGLRQFLTFENLLKMMKNAFHFKLKAFFVLEIFTFLS